MARDLQEIAKQIADKNFPVNWPGHLIDNEWREIKKGSPIKASFNPNNNQKLIEVCGDKESVLLAIESAVNERKKNRCHPNRSTPRTTKTLSPSFSRLP